MFLAVLNGGNTRQYLILERDTRQGNPISTYLFIVVLELIFSKIILNKSIKGIELFQKEFLYTTNVDDTTFFL